MARKRTAGKSAAASKRRSEAKKALAAIEKAQKSLQLNLKKLRAALGGPFGPSLGGPFGSGGGPFGR